MPEQPGSEIHAALIFAVGYSAFFRQSAVFSILQFWICNSRLRKAALKASCPLSSRMEVEWPLHGGKAGSTALQLMNAAETGNDVQAATQNGAGGPLCHFLSLLTHWAADLQMLQIFRCCVGLWHLTEFYLWVFAQYWDDVSTGMQWLLRPGEHWVLTQCYRWG